MSSKEIKPETVVFNEPHTYKDNIYTPIQKIKVKHPDTGCWFEAVEYKGENGEVYAREYEDFNNKFKNTRPIRAIKISTNITYGGDVGLYPRFDTTLDTTYELSHEGLGLKGSAVEKYIGATEFPAKGGKYYIGTINGVEGSEFISPVKDGIDKLRVAFANAVINHLASLIDE